MTVGCSDWKCWIELLAKVFEIGGFVAAAWWFLYTTQFKPRIQFDVGCEVRGLGSGLYLLEVLFMFENKGFVEHRLYDLSLSVHGIGGGRDGRTSAEPGARILSKRLFPKTTIVPREYGWYFVRPGVRQLITHQLVLQEPGPLIEITAGFTYHRRSAWPHTARRVFEVSSHTSTALGTSPEPDVPTNNVTG